MISTTATVQLRKHVVSSAGFITPLALCQMLLIPRLPLLDSLVQHISHLSRTELRLLIILLLILLRTLLRTLLRKLLFTSLRFLYLGVT